MKDIYLLLHTYGPWLVFGNVLLEQAGLPIPAYPLLIAAGALAAQGDLGWAAALVAAVLACLIADAGWYAGGRRYGGGLLGLICRVSLSRDSCIRQTQVRYTRVGPRVLLIAKFLPGASALSTVMAGHSRMPLRRFLMYDGAGAAIWAGSALIIGAAFRDTLARLLEFMGEYGGYGLMMLAGALGLYLLWRLARRRRTRNRYGRVPRIPLTQLHSLQSSGQAPVLLDVRAVPEDPLPGAIHVDPHGTPQAQQWQWPRDTHIVVYCACPDELTAAVLVDKLRRAGFRNAVALLGGYDGWRASRVQTSAGVAPCGGAAPDEAAAALPVLAAASAAPDRPATSSKCG